MTNEVVINKADQLRKAQEAAKQFKEAAPVANTATEEVEAKEPVVEAAAPQKKSSPWRDDYGLSEEQLRMSERGLSGSMDMELHLRLTFIKNRLNGESIAKGKKNRVSVNQLHIQAIEEYTTKILKKWGYDV